MTAAVLVLVDANTRPAVDDSPVGTRPLTGVDVVPVEDAALAQAVERATRTSTGTAVPDDLAAAVTSAMTLFGRVEVRHFDPNPQYSNGRWVAP